MCLGQTLSQVPQPVHFSSITTGSPSGILFWYRRSPGPLVPFGSFDQTSGGKTIVAPDDPPADEEGMVGVTLDSRGRLLDFRAVPGPLHAEGEHEGPALWERVFAAAGLERERFVPVEPRLTPSVFADGRRAWTGPCPGTIRWERSASDPCRRRSTWWTTTTTTGWARSPGTRP